MLTVPGYKMFRKDGQNAKGGGVMIYAKESFNCNEIQINNENDLEFLSLNITLSQQMSFTLAVIYRPPSFNVEFYDKLALVIKQLNFAKEVIIMGDLNINWEVYQVRKHLKKNMDEKDLIQVISGPTRLTTSLW